MRKYWKEQNAETEASVRQVLTLDRTRWQYVTGVPDVTLVDPDTWQHDYALLSRPGNDLVQLSLFLDPANSALYPLVQKYFREQQVPLLAIWGRNDPILGPGGALALAQDLPTADVYLIEGGHFLLESALDEAVPLIRDFLAASL